MSNLTGNVTNSMIKNFFDFTKPLVKGPVIERSGSRGLINEGVPNPNVYIPKFKLDKKPGPRLQASPLNDPYPVNSALNVVANPGIEGDLMKLELDDVPINSDESPIPKTDEPHMYEHYDYDHQYDQGLPITKFQEQIVNTIESNSVTVIQGSTGSGKTTQVPQYILDYYVEQRSYCNIIVTQPRRIAAISIAKRVSKERGWKTGGIVGYQVARDKVVTEDTRINYVTTGVLLQKLITAKNMNQYTHVILDEVHERDQESDFCMLIVRKLLRSISKHVKVVLMSATMNSDLFAHYFSVPIHGSLEKAPVVSVEGKIFSVKEIYLEDMAPYIQGHIPMIKKDEPGIDEDSYNFATLLIRHFDKLEARSQVARGKYSRGSVLIFLPGIREINDMNTALEDVCGDLRLSILPLHSQITSEEQQKVFDHPRDPDFRKVILSTNIAESSITVPDVKYVIDFCLTKCLMCDRETNFQSLKLQWASKANATQRKGRAGRVSTGECYRMVTKEFYRSCLPEYGTPEMRRCPLDQLVLQVKLLDLGEPRAILGLALEPPDLDDIEKSVLILKEVGALTVLKDGVLNPFDGDLTFLGKVLGTLPVDIKIGKLLVLGNVFGVLEECLVIAAFLSLKSFFARPYRKDLDAYRYKMGWDDFAFSDCMASLKAFQTWSQHKASGGFGKKGERKWCEQFFIQMNRIREVAELVSELEERVKHFGLRTRGPIHKKNISSSGHDILIIKLVIAGAFYPNYFLSSEIDEADAAKTMSGHDPFTTVMVRGMPPHGNLYRSTLARLFRPCGQGRALHFEDTRGYIEFEHPQRSRESPHPVLPPVYMALKMRELRLPLTIYMSQKDTASVKMELRDMFAEHSGNRLRTNRVGSYFTSSSQGMSIDQPKQVVLPNYGYLEIFTTEVIDAGHFWAQMAEAEHQRALGVLMDRINIHGGKNFIPMPKDFNRGCLCLAAYEDTLFYRARIEAYVDQHKVEVLYVDYGNVAILNIKDLRQIPKEFLKLPFQAFECYLSGIRPSYNVYSSGDWTPEARDFFMRLTSSEKLVAKIFSNVRNTLHIDLYDTTTEEDVHINEMLVTENYAQYMEEPYYSKMAHQDGEAEQRLKESSGKNFSSEVTDSECGWEESELPKNETVDDFRDKVTKVSLNGPYNPYEMTWMNITNIGHLKPARVERDSVNSICIDTEPQDKHPHLLVAASVSVNPSGNTMIARETTMMPNIHGLLSFVGLLFAPYAEMRTDPELRQYTGALIGLGPDLHTGEAILPDHDIEIVFDVHFDNNDLVLINTTRTAINMMMDPSSGLGTGGEERIQVAAREKLIHLLFNRKREDRKLTTFKRPYQWNQICTDSVLEPMHPKDDVVMVDVPVYSLHRGVAISGQSLVEEGPSERVLFLRESVKKLRDLAGSSSERFGDEVVCELCNVICRHPRGVSIHMETRIHKDEEKLLFEE